MLASGAELIAFRAVGGVFGNGVAVLALDVSGVREPVVRNRGGLEVVVLRVNVHRSALSFLASEIPREDRAVLQHGDAVILLPTRPAKVQRERNPFAAVLLLAGWADPLAAIV